MVGQEVPRARRGVAGRGALERDAVWRAGASSLCLGDSSVPCPDECFIKSSSLIPLGSVSRTVGLWVPILTYQSTGLCTKRAPLTKVHSDRTQDREL